jgi:diguanylate cyclase
MKIGRMINIGHLRLRSLSMIVSLATVLLFLSFYLAFKYFWTYNVEYNNAVRLQAHELERVETLLEIKQEELKSWTADNAAWNDLIHFIHHPNDAFKLEELNTHTLMSNQLDAFFIYDDKGIPVWSLGYDYELGRNIDVSSLETNLSPIIYDLEKVQRRIVSPIARFVVLNNQPYLIAASRVCHSDAYDCQYGYLIFIRKIRQEFTAEMNKASGLTIEIHPYRMSDLLVHQKGQVAAYPNISYIPVFSSLDREHLLIEVHHNVKLPSFLEWQEVTALGGFSVLMFVIFLWLSKLLIKPITTAHQVLTQFKQSGGRMPLASSFLSKEMQEFAQTMNALIEEIEANRSELEWQSDHDPLTRIANRRGLEKHVKAFIVEKKSPYLMVFLIDIDHFKRYNDHYGHIMGDVALKQVAKALCHVDFSGRKVVSRFGGEEFCIVCASDVPQDADDYAKQLWQAIVDLNIVHELSPTKPILSISIGGVSITAPSLTNYLSYFHQADAALYQSKHQGRDQWMINVYDHSKNDGKTQHNEGLNSIR